MARAPLFLGRTAQKITMIRFHVDASPESRGRISMAVDKIRIAPDRTLPPAGYRPAVFFTTISSTAGCSGRSNAQPMKLPFAHITLA